MVIGAEKLDVGQIGLGLGEMGSRPNGNRGRGNGK